MSSKDLKTKYKYIRWLCNDAVYTINAGIKRPIYACLNNRTNLPLGGATYYPRWKQYIFEAEVNCVFSSECLADIQDFLEQLNGDKN